MRKKYKGTFPFLQKKIEDSEVLKGLKEQFSNFTGSDEFQKIAEKASSVASGVASSVGETFGKTKEKLSPFSGALSSVAKGCGLCAVGAGVAAAGFLSLAASAANGKIDIQAVCDDALATVQNLTDNLPQVAAQMAETIPGFVGALADALPLLMESISAAMETVVGMLPQIIPLLGEMLPTVMTSLIGMIAAFAPDILSAGFVLFNSIVSSLPLIIPALLEAVPSVVGAVCGALPTFVPTLLNVAVSLFMALVRAVPLVLSSLLEAIGSLIAGALDFIGNKASDMGTVAKDMMNGLIDGIKNCSRSVIEAIGGVVDNAIGWAKSLLGIASPSKVFKSIGGYVSEGFADGVAAKANEAVRAMKDMVCDVTDAARANLPSIDIPIAFGSRELASSAAGLRGGFGFPLAMAGFGSQSVSATNTYYTIEKVDLSSNQVAVKAAESLWGTVRRQMRMG